MATFGELLAKVPSAKRSTKVKTILALHCAAVSGGTATTAEVQKLLRLHLRGKAPANVTNELTRATPYVETVERKRGRHTWRLTESGVTFLRGLLGEGALIDPKAQLLKFDDLHPDIRRATEALLQDRHYSEAVGRAVKALNLMIRRKTGRDRDDGVAMMHQVFSATPNGTTRLQVNDLKEAWKRDEQEGVRFMMAGVQAGIANVDKHGDLGVGDPVHAMEVLAALSFLARVVDRSRAAS